MTLNRSLRAVLLGAASLAAASAASAETMRFAIGWPPGNVAHEAFETYAAKVNELSDGELTVRVFPLSLLNFAEASEGLRDGIADMATILTPYFLATYPKINQASELASLMELQDDKTRAPLAFGAALAEFVMLHCEECQEETAAQNSVFTAAASTPSYILQCVTPITSVEDLQGKRVRSAGAFWSRWAEGMGAVPISLSINETFEGLSQGVLDCTMSNTSDFSNFSFIDVVTHLTMGVPGSGFPSSLININRDAWQGLSTEQRATLLEASATGSAYMGWNYYQEGIDNIENKAPERGIEVLQADDELVAKSKAFIEADVENIVSTYEERFGVETGADSVAKMRELIAKWTPMVQDAESADELAELYWTELYSKVDPATYGM